MAVPRRHAVDHVSEGTRSSSRSRCWPTGSWPNSPQAEGERRVARRHPDPGHRPGRKRLTWAEVVAVGPERPHHQGGRQGAVQPRRLLRGRGAGRRLHHPAASATSTPSPRAPRRRHRPVPVSDPPVGGPARVATPIASSEAELSLRAIRRRRARARHRPGRRRRRRPDDGVHERRRPCAGPLRRGGRGSGAGAARSTGARARPRATASGCAQVHYDCDGDTLLVTVDQDGAGACHTGERSCFFRAFGDAVAAGRSDGRRRRRPE